jgi:NAD(P)-dependent dehydrogenase (short-subunit alcohol dehydrogenase family)
VHDLPRLDGSVIIVTGASSGLGLESTRQLARQGAAVVLASRSAVRCDEARASILADQPSARVVTIALDLGDLSSVRAFAQRFTDEFDRLDVLMNNAGVMGAPRGVTVDGFEKHIGINHLGHFALTGGLLPVLLRTPGARVVTVSSSAHRGARLNLRDLRVSRYTPMRAYGKSKLANLLFAFELQRRFERHGVDCASVAAHPGASQTNLGRHIEDALVFRLLNPLLVRVVPTPESGALSQLRAAVDPGVRGGEYVGPNGMFEMRGHPVLVRSSRASRNERRAQRLWRLSERLTGVVYRFA